MEPLLIYFDEAAYKSKVGRLETLIELFEKAIELYNSFDIGKFKTNDLESLICNTEYFVSEKMFISKDVKLINALGLNKAKVIALMDKPIGYAALLETVVLIEKRLTFSKIEENYQCKDIKQLLRFYTFNEENKIVLKQSYYDSYKEENKKYIHTEKAKNVYNFGIELLNLCKKYDIEVRSLYDPTKLCESLFGRPSSILGLDINYIKLVDHYELGR